MEKRKVTSEGYFRMLLILFGAMLMSQMSMVGIFLFLVLTGEWAETPDMLIPMAYAVPAVACIGFGLSFVLPVRLMAAAADKATLSEKLRGYQMAMIIKIVLLEIPALLGCVGFYMTGSYFFLIANVVSIALFANAFPARNKVIEALRLSGAEIDVVNDGQAVVMEYDISDAD
jgi:hypothetical protein